MNYAIDRNAVSDDAKHMAVFLQKVLDRVVTAYASYNMPLPTRRYYTFGDPVMDCEQVVVTFIQAYIGAPGDEANAPRRASDPRSATLNITVSRAIPVVGVNGRPPTAEAIQSGSEIIAYDAYILLDSASKFDTWEEVGFGIGVIATIEVKAPEGGIQTTSLTVTTAIP
jgi:hypothetical protein